MGFAALCDEPFGVHSALWHEVEALAEQGLVGLAVLNSKSFVVHHGATSGTEDDMVYGTNPMAFAFPRPDGLPPLLWDQVRTCFRFLTRANTTSTPAVTQALTTREW